MRRFKELVHFRRSRYARLHLAAGDSYLDFEICLNFSFEQGRSYQYSKLYFCWSPDQAFHESRVICFQPQRRNTFQRMRIRLPAEVVESGFLAVRIDGLPYSKGSFQVKGLRTTTGKSEAGLTRRANLLGNRQQVRAQVLQSEAAGSGRLPHYPESLSLELTPRCNLVCPHCSSHGTAELHRHHNKLPEMSIELFDRIADELFPHITTLSLVGRGEPTMASHRLWRHCMERVIYHDIKVSCVTNGHFIPQRFTPDYIPYIDELCISMDGNSEQTHGVNRGGSSLKKVLDNIAYFDSLRKRSALARRPRISFYWTLMRNNVHELPEFIRAAARFDPDYYAIRHLVVFRERDRHLSLLGNPEESNEFLQEAYFELERRGISYEAPPLMADDREQESLPEGIIAREPAIEPEVRLAAFSRLSQQYLAEPCTWMYRTGIISYDGEVTSCGKHYGELMGKLDQGTDFDTVWNGPAMASLRSTFNTPDMWQQCKECWIRELRWHTQRHTRGFETGSGDNSTGYTRAAWDYRAYSDL